MVNPRDSIAKNPFAKLWAKAAGTELHECPEVCPKHGTRCIAPHATSPKHPEWTDPSKRLKRFRDVDVHVCQGGFLAHNFTTPRRP